jgi:hypothetical protein
MTACSDDRDTKAYDGVPTLIPLKVYTGTTIYEGSIVAIDTAHGYAVPASTSTTQICCGRAEEQVVNAGASGAKTVNVRTGVFQFANSGTSIAQANVGAHCYLVDDQTVHLTDGSATRSRAGVITAVDSSGVYVHMSPFNYEDSATLTGTETLTNKRFVCKPVTVAFVGGAATASVAAGNYFHCETVAMNSVLTIDPAGAVEGDIIEVTRDDTDAFTVEVTDGVDSWITMSASKFAGVTLRFNGTKFIPTGVYQET